MDFVDLLEKRRSVREFEDKEVPLELIKEIINDSIKAPNAGNLQLWRFIIITNKEWLRRLSDANKETILADIAENPNSPYRSYENILRNKDYSVFHHAPCLVYVVGTIKALTLPIDCGLLGAYFMLSAASRGLGTCWVALGGEIKDQGLLKEIGVPENYRITAPIVMGYPKNIPAMPERKEPKIIKVIS